MIRLVKCGLFLLLFLGFSSQLLAHWRPGEMEVKVTCSSREEAAQIRSLGVSVDFHAGYAVAYLVEEELTALQRMGFDTEILERNLDQRNGKGVPPGYYSYQEIIDIADSLATHFPAICSKTVVGYTPYNRQLAYLKISDNVLTDEPEPEVLFDAGIHGDEIGASQNVIMYARDMVLGYGNDPEITELINNREIFLYLMVNPDGRENMSRYNSNGMDLNRDWGYMWDHEGNTDSAFCQVESRALRDLILQHEFVVHTTYHSGTEYISCPWSYRADAPEDAVHILHLAGVYSSVSGYPNLGYGQGSTGMYYINGASKDYNYGAVGSISWSMEISHSKQPPSSQVGMYYNYNKPSMHAMCRYSGYGIEGMITDAATGEPVSAVVLIDNLYPVHTDPLVGDFHKYLTGGTYSVKVKANGYKEAIVEGVVVESDTSTTHIDIVLEPEEGHHIHYLDMVEIPGNNFDDEAYTPAIYGAPDGVCYSLGRDGFLRVDMGTPIFDKSGMDFTVYEGDNTAEGYNVYASTSIDGPYHLVGEGTGTTTFNLGTAGLVSARYLEIRDDGMGAGSGNNAGFDLDAIAVINPPVPVINPSPEDNSTSSVFSTLSWEQGGGGIPSFYTLYFGTDNPPTNILSGDTIEGTSYSFPSPLAYDTLYYWRVDAENQYGVATGTVWQFTTETWPDEDFETGDFSLFDWTFGGDAPWVITEDETRNGVYAAKSGAIGDGQTSSLILEGNSSGFGMVSFWQKTSSDPENVLAFYINGTLMDSWSGDGTWTECSYGVGPGACVLEWRYLNNTGGSGGDDAAYVDFMHLPEFAASPPPTVNAGEDMEVCEGDTVWLNATAANYDYLQWSTDGDGTFNNPSILDPQYYPGPEEVAEGGASLTLTVFGSEQVSDQLLLSIDPLPGVPGPIEGEVTCGYNLGAYEYTVDSVAHAQHYFWEVLPPDLSTLTGNGNDTVFIDYLEGDYPYTVSIRVKAVNACGESLWSDSLSVVVTFLEGVSGYDDHHLRLYPNPVQTDLRLEGLPGVAEVAILDFTGTPRILIPNYVPEEAMDVRMLHAGVYMVRVTLGEQVWVHKLIKH